jgi:hypothetical protein
LREDKALLIVAENPRLSYMEERNVGARDDWSCDWSCDLHKLALEIGLWKLGFGKTRNTRA